MLVIVFWDVLEYAWGMAWGCFWGCVVVLLVCFGIDLRMFGGCLEDVWGCVGAAWNVFDNSFDIFETKHVYRKYRFCFDQRVLLVFMA